MRPFDPASPDPTDLERPVGLHADPWSAVTEDEDERRQDAWLLNYVDVLMLLLTLLVVLLVLQRQEGLLSKLMMEVAIPVVSQDVVPSVPTETRTQQPEDAPHEVSDKQQAQPDALEAKEPHPITPEAKPETPPEQMLAEAAEPPAPQAQEVKPPTSGADQTGGGAQALAEVLAWNGLTEGLLIVATDSQLRMEALDDILFSPASTELTERGEVLLGDLAEVLRLHPGELSIEGHADNRPIHNENYPSNWELSSARAARVVRFLVEHSIPAQRMRAIGYSDTRPKADNTTEDGRTSNRRVTLVLELAPAPSKTALR